MGRVCPSAGLLTAVAGSLTAENADAVLAADPDIVGIRGAACEGGGMARSVRLE